MGSEARPRGAVCLANDAVVEWLIPFCESLHRHNPELPLTLIPFGDRLAKTREVLSRFGYELYDGPALPEVSRIAAGYWPNEPFKQYVMRKFCAWDTYETFLFMDADIVVLRSLEPYFEAMEASDADFMHFATDIVQVYKPGPVRERMVADHETAGFNSGVFMGRHGQLQPKQLESLASSAAELRHGFVDNLEQTFINYCVDVAPLRKVDANDIVDDLAVAGGLMRIVRSQGGDDDYILEDHRVPYSGRRVSMIHWGGYEANSAMPYRDLFLRYRLPGAGRSERMRYDVRAAALQIADGSIRGAYHGIRSIPSRIHNRLAARGLAEWRGTGD